MEERSIDVLIREISGQKKTKVYYLAEIDNTFVSILLHHFMLKIFCLIVPITPNAPNVSKFLCKDIRDNKDKW
jgi:hypothetical protein